MREQIRALLPKTFLDRADCLKRLRQLEDQFPDLQHTRRAEEIQSQVLAVLLQGRPATELKHLPEPLAYLVSRLEPVSEATLGPDGRLQSATAYRLGPLLVELLEQLSAQTRAQWPHTPWPGEIFAGSETPPPAPAPPGPWLEKLAALALRLSQLGPLLEQASSQITRLDRLNVFTDSPAEAAQKKYTAEIQAIQQQWDQALQEFHQQALSLREQNYACFLNDRLVSLQIHLPQITTFAGKKRKPIDCQLFGAETLLPHCQQLVQRQQQTHGFSGDSQSLVGQVCAASAQEPGVAGQLKALLGDTLNLAVQAVEQAEAGHQQAQRQVVLTKGEVTFVDKINIFRVGPREKAAQAAVQYEREQAQAAQLARNHVEELLKKALAELPEAHFYYLTENLEQKCRAVRAICNVQAQMSEVEHAPDIKTYWCEIIGVEVALREAIRCSKLQQARHGTIPGLYGWLTWLRLAEVQDPSLRSLIRNIDLPS